MDTVLAPVPLGRGRLVREGKDLAIIAVGTQLGCALETAERLEAELNIKAAVADARFVKPLDAELLGGLARSCPRIVTMEEHAVQGGFGSAVLEMLAQAGIQVPALCLGLPDRFIEHGTVAQLKELTGISLARVFDRIKDFCAAEARR